MTSWFEQLVGKENISDELIDLEVYSTDGSQIKGKADKVLWVTDAEQVHQIILYARRNKQAIVPRGAGTSLVGGVVPFDAIVMDFAKMNKILSIQKYYAEVEPGVVFSDLNNRLGDMFFPVVPEDGNICTIGGMCGINSSGFYEKRYGRMKDWILGIEMIDGTGKLRKCGNEVIGTEGLLGAITKIKLKLTDRVFEKSMDVFTFSTIEEMLSKVSDLKFNKEVLAIEYISVSAAILSGLENKHYLIVEYEGLNGKITEAKEIEKIWQIRKGVYKKLASKGFTFLEDPSVSLENMAEFIYWLEKKGIPSFGPIGVNVLHPCFDKREDIRDMYDAVLRLHGDVGKRTGYGILKKDFVSDLFRMEIKNLKEIHDPNGIMNKGKVI